MSKRVLSTPSPGGECWGEGAFYMRSDEAVILHHPPPLLGERVGVRALCIFGVTKLPHLNPLPQERKQTA